MLPISVDLARVPVLLVGNGPAALRRLRLLDEAGADALEIYSPAPDPELAALAGARLRRRWPSRDEIVGTRLLFIAGVAEAEVTELIRIAQRACVLVNVEDDTRHSDFHSAAVLRRGDLTVAISTNGRSPGLAALLRRQLEQLLDPEWQVRLDRLASLRRGWRAAGADPAAIGRWTRQWAARHAALAASPPEPSQHRLPPIG
ncbi:MAG TPA: NAD(P)-dependent oxidoreductase [Stellaceae bacterium]|jgi:precorrin-2 dehydrogenase / sirohydrochlorin ferrochelatase|nr:NAD(P)-dependent oxidoreductase [Stellaceae bacterium]